MLVRLTSQYDKVLYLDATRVVHVGDYGVNSDGAPLSLIILRDRVSVAVYGSPDTVVQYLQSARIDDPQVEDLNEVA